MSLQDLICKIRLIINIKSVIVLCFVFTISYMYVTGKFVPIELLTATLVIIGLYFGYMVKKNE